MPTYYYADTERLDNARTSWFRTEKAALTFFNLETQNWSDRDLHPYTREIVDPSPQEIQAEILRAEQEGQAHDLPIAVIRYRLYVTLYDGLGRYFCGEYCTLSEAVRTAKNNMPRPLNYGWGLVEPDGRGVEDDRPLDWIGGEYFVMRTVYSD